MTEWNGKERRAMSSEDHDILIGIKSDTKHIVDTISKHIGDDKIAFEKIDTKIGWLQKIVFMGLGALALLKVFVK